ncbi:hypothetical protein A2995_01770 [Candidatus Nomurabacteria bacterium RIFCSPLOWO2_01_FULL_33_24]|uniref:Metallo-beta-lactamase domain-containing protein n=1 Tax=Candidatus Nomurabacteria bacterium RIFCSPLOWO2_01_FULL_33_24 TaxID=1801765 RepID=A0A1F6X1T5_9BACT|nr:MAG: hypothetical protein A2995_01770 [Candidatus Nomurabacteria bacterium RIFCSPLOWO2_01_FULL_33_24]
MVFEQIKVGIMENFSYLIGDKKEGALIDPGWDSQKLLKIAGKKRLKINKVLLTHSHYDHLNDLEEITKETKAQVFIHQLETFENKNIEIKYIKDNDIINVGNIKIQVIHTPGHSRGSVCFLFDQKLLTGDTLFIGSIGRVDLEGGSEGEMFQSLKKLSELDNKIEVYPGHHYSDPLKSTIGQEKANNPFMKF